MSGLLPATITKWFSSPSSSNTNGSAQVADATDSSTEDEALESPVITQPPAKRMRYSQSGNFNQFVPVETKCTSTNTEPIDEPPNTVQSPMDRSNIRRDNFFASTRLKSSDSYFLTQNESFLKSQCSMSPVNRCMGKKRKSLFDNATNDSIHQPSQTNSGSTRDPYFKPSLLSSPFYVGRTMYGGAASSYMNQPNIKRRKINLTGETSNINSVTMSHSAKRVMDLLEHYSSPLIEAKRIPPFQVTKQSEMNSSNDSTQKYVNPYGSKVFSYKTQELCVPSVASIISIKRKSRLMDTTNAARQIIASHSSTSEFLPYPKSNSENSQKDASGDRVITKVKSRLTRANRERNIDLECDTADKVTLPNVVLQIDKDNLPKFTFDSTQTGQLPNASMLAKPVKVTPDTTKASSGNDISAVFVKTKDNKIQVNKSAEEIDAKEDIYKFSSPVKISSESANSASTPPTYNFGSPDRNIEQLQEQGDIEGPLGLRISSQNVTENQLPVPKSSDWKCLDCWVLNKIDVKNCICCGGKKPVDLEDSNKNCSSCNILPSQSNSDKCSGCAKRTNNIVKTLGATTTNSSKWKCSDCWVDNDQSASKCVCCGGKNPKNQVTSAGTSSETKVESEWKCNDCWIKNKSTLDKCAACCASRPVTISSEISMMPKSNDIPKEPKVVSDNTFKLIAKSQCENWECPICLVRNESNRSTCVCCEADKPGIVKESQKKLFNFHQPAEITFKFGIQPTNQELQKKTQNIETEEANMGEESETNNNVVSKASSFTFGLPLKKIDEKSDNQVTKPEGVPNISFGFGIPKDTGVPSIFLTSNKLSDLNKTVEENEKPQEVPRIFTPPASEGMLKTSVSLFKPPVTSQNAQEILTTLPIQAPTTTKELSFFNAPVMTTANSELKTPQNRFTFSSIKPATNLFAATTTTSAPTSITAPVTLTSQGTGHLSIFQKPDATTTTTVSFFQSSNSATTTTASVFPKADATLTTPSVSLGSAQPVFSFGSSAPALQTEKNKFQFSFGNNKTETPSLFKPSFGTSNDNNASNSNFNISSNSITTGNGLSANPLNNTTQVNAANPLTTGNSLSSQAPSLFGTPLSKEGIWPTNNMFATNTSTNTVQKPPAFTFGCSTPYNANNATFGTNTQSGQNVFGIPSTTSQPMFSSPVNNQTVNIFASQQTPSNPCMGMFGTTNTIGTPAFGTVNPTMTFEAPGMTPTPTPTFNFGGQQPSGIFGFGQQQNQASQQVDSQQPQSGLYNFGAPAGAPQQLQFNMGSAPQTGRRVIRKAMRRTQR